MTVHVHDPGGDGFNRTKILCRQDAPDEDGSGKDTHENNFPAAGGGRRFGFQSFHATMLGKIAAGRELKKMRGTLKK
jgi:hypothetical protein